MTLHEDPITGDVRLVAPGRAARLGRSSSGCPFCPGHEDATPTETGRIAARAHVDAGASLDAGWSARSFPNLYPLTDPHEVLVPTPRHVTAWRDLTLPELEAGLELLLERRRALLAPDRYVHAFVNDGIQAGASLQHVHAQLVSVPAGTHAERLTRGVRMVDDHCALCDLMGAPTSPYLVERGRHLALVAHPLPRIAGALLVTPLTHASTIGMDVLAELAALLHRALQVAARDTAINLWIVADEAAQAHWYVELQPRTAYLAGVELALGLNVVGADPLAAAAHARERLAQPAQG
ncbi:MAG: galactose-phosphate uridylyltransferase [Thermoleophilia bacterium]|nr:galactose-phosphate uridylyltransferase [Thermoleophilia bacterium]